MLQHEHVEISHRWKWKGGEGGGSQCRGADPATTISAARVCAWNVELGQEETSRRIRRSCDLFVGHRTRPWTSARRCRRMYTVDGRRNSRGRLWRHAYSVPIKLLRQSYVTLELRRRQRTKQQESAMEVMAQEVFHRTAEARRGYLRKRARALQEQLRQLHVVAPLADDHSHELWPREFRPPRHGWTKEELHCPMDRF